MNIKNALGFLILGTLMYVSPAFSQSPEAQQIVIANDSARTLWLEFMGWVIGGIGSVRLLRESVVRMPALVALFAPVRPVENNSEPMRLPVGARVGVSN